MFKDLINIFKNLFTIKKPLIYEQFNLKDLPISKRELNYIEKAGIKSLETVINLVENEELTKINRVGKKTQKKLQNWMKEYNK
jgi:DNA-directed RNA polymerase alpha subunit